MSAAQVAARRRLFEERGRAALTMAHQVRLAQLEGRRLPGTAVALALAVAAAEPLARLEEVAAVAGVTGRTALGHLRRLEALDLVHSPDRGHRWRPHARLLERARVA